MNIRLLCILAIFSKDFRLTFCLSRNTFHDKPSERFIKKQNLIELITDDLNDTSNYLNTKSNNKLSNYQNIDIQIQDSYKNEKIDDTLFILENDELIFVENIKNSTSHGNNYVNNLVDDVDGSGDNENELLLRNSNYKKINTTESVLQPFSTTQPKPGQRSLVIVFDGTASMTDDLDQLRDGAEYIIEKLTSRNDNPIFNYIFVPFRDPDVGPKLVTTNHQKLLNELKVLKLRGGGDCPEHALGGIISALESALPRSFIYVFTDAVASDYYLQDEVLRLVQKKQTQITFFITGYCKLENSLEHLVFQKIASASNGQVFDLKKKNIKEVIESFELLLNVNRIPVKYIDSTSNDTHSIDLNVDKTLTEFTVSVAGSEPNITVRNPKNKTINNSADILNLDNLKIVKIRDPEIGTWNIQAGSVSPHSVQLSGISDITYEYGFTTKREPLTFYDISQRPIANQGNVLSIIPSDPSLIDKLTAITLKLFTDDNDRERFTFDLPLKKIIIDDKEVYVTIPIPLPRQLFKISIAGKDRKGNPFERLLSTAITTDITTEAPEVYMEVDTYESKEGDKIILKCKIDSLLPIVVRWMRNSRILKHFETSQQHYEFNYQIDHADVSDSGRYTCEAENLVGVVSKLATVKVFEKALIVFTPKKHIENVEGDTNILLECNINLNDGVDVSWSLNDQELLYDLNYEMLENSNLLIKLITRNESGIYKCYGHYGGQIKHDFVQMDVKYPVETNENLIENITLPYGESITITCNGIGNPIPNASWTVTLFNRKYFLNEKSIYIENMTVNNEGIYMCKLYNGIGDPILRVVNLEGGPSKSPLNIIKSSDEPSLIIVNENDNVNISCQCINCSPVLQNKWIAPHNNLLLDNNVKLNSYTIYQSTEEGLIKRYNNNLFIENIKLNQSGNYRCELENTHGSDYMIYRVKVVPTNSIFKLNEGNTFSIRCELENNEQPSKVIEWRKDGEIILNNIDNKNVILENDNNTLVVNAVRYSDAGIYSCKSVEPSGNTIKNFTLLIVVHKMQSIQTATLGDRVILPCKLRQLTSPEVTWRLNGRDLNIASVDQNLGKYTQINNSLLFKADSTDTGIYQCQSINQDDHTVVEEDLVLVIYSSPHIYPARDEIIEVTSNSDILLECKSNGLPFPIITWFFDNHVVENSSLLIENVSRTDEGPYICNAFNGIGTQQKVFHIVVYDKPKIISYVPESIRISSDEKINITCDAIGNPEPIVHWSKIEMSNKIDLNIINNIIEINSSIKSGIYICVAENRFGVDKKHMTVEIIEHPRIKRNYTEQLYFNSIEVLVKDSAKIICPIENYKKITWYKNGKPINVRLQPHNNMNIIIPSASSHNDGNYTCVAESNGKTLNYTIELHVLEPPNYLQSVLLNSRSPENITSTSDFEIIHEIKIKAGDHFIINCSSKGKPEPQYFWSKNGNILVNNSLLKIYDLTLNDSGIYTCTAENFYGDIYQSYELIVISEPKPRNVDNDEEYIVMGAGDNTKLNCDMDGYPYPEFQWFKNSVPLAGEYQEIIEIWNSDIKDSGEYQCLATNEHGANKKTFYLNIFDPPSINFISPAKTTIRPTGFNFICNASGIPMPILTWMYNGRLLTTTSRLSNTNLNNLYETMENTEIYIDQHGNGFTINNVLPFDIEFINKVKIQNLETVQNYGIVRVVNKTVISLELIFPKSRLELSGKYDCIAINSNGRANESASVEVIVSPHNPFNKKLLQSDETTNSVTGIETIMGLPILLRCPFVGNPKPVYNWYKDNEEIKIGLKNTNFDITGQQLLITESTQEHNGKYSCVASNVGGTIEQKFNVSILVPPTFLNNIQSINDNNLDEYDLNGNKIGQIEIKLNLGDTLSLECPVYAIPKPEIFWFKLIHVPGQHPLNNPLKILQTTNSNLIIPSVKESAIYVCSANNTIGTVDKLYHVFVESPPIVNRTNSEENEILPIFEVTAQIYHGFTLECNIVGTPEPKIRWMKNKIEIKKSYRVDETFDDEKYEDFYNFNESFDSEFNLDYNNLVTHDTTKINKRQFIQESGIFISSDRRVLRVISSSKEDGGEYSCFGKNKHGIAEQIFNVKINVPVEFSPWGPWTACSTSCGKGIQRRYRTCLLPNGDFATELDNKCNGDDTQFQNCEDSPCPINGGWSEWSHWSPCTSSCIDVAGGIDSVRRRYRKCNAPAPKRGGRPCLGASTQIESCVVENCPINGGWTVWSEWSLCSATCGGGAMKRNRYCTNPEALYGGMQCNGQDYEVKPCLILKCPIDGGWSSWTPWSYCSKSCGLANFKQRKRTCNQPEPAFGGKTCHGGNIEISSCPFKECPFKNSHVKSIASFKSNQKMFTPLLSFDTLPLSRTSTYEEPLIKSPPKYAESQIPPTEYALPQFQDSQISLKIENMIPIQSNIQELNLNIPIIRRNKPVNIPQPLRKAELISYTNCGKGFKENLYNSEICIDINECHELENPCRQNEVCINKIGSFTCECSSGYISLKPGSPCLDINECTQRIHNCSHNCHNTDGSYKCSCPDNFLLSENEHMCILSRMPREKQNSIFKLELTDLCKEGFHLKNGKCVDVDECLTKKDDCNFNQMCLNTHGSFTCLQAACPELYVRDHSSEQCVQMCIDFPDHKCPDGAVIAQSISYTVITLPLKNENIPFLKLVSYDVFNNPLKNTEFMFVNNSHHNHLFGLETFDSSHDEPSGNIYILVKNFDLIKKEQIYELNVLAKSYDLDSTTLLYVTQFIVYVYKI